MYITQQQLIDRFGEQELIQLTDRVNQSVIDAVVLAEAIADADAEIDAYLRPRYPLPLVSVPSELLRVAADLTRYRLYDDAVIDAVQERRDHAIEFLRALSQGRASLPDSVLNIAANGSSAMATPNSRLTIYTDELLATML
jgi:phage gp36-like protein